MGELIKVSQEIIKIAVIAVASLLALSVALGGVEGQIGTMLGDPSMGRSAKGRIIALIIALVIVLSAIPISNAVSKALVH